MKKKVLFIDRDGTLVVEPPVDYQLDSLEKLEFYPKVFRNLSFIRSKLDFEFVMVTNQDGLGTASFPEETFWPAHNLMLKTLEGEGIVFDDILIDRSLPADNAPTRKPRTGMLTAYLNNDDYDLAGSFVIGDRATDVELARNLGCRAIFLQDSTESLREKGLEEVCALATTNWDRVAEFLFAGERKAEVRRQWPGRLEVSLEEHVPAAFWGQATGQLVNTHGEVFTASLQTLPATPMPVLTGPAGLSVEMLGYYRQAVEILRPLGRTPQSLTISPRLAVQLRLDDGMLVELGRDPRGVR